MQAQAEHSPQASQMPRQTKEDHAAASKQHKLPLSLCSQGKQHHLLLEG